MTQNGSEGFTKANHFALILNTCIIKGLLVTLLYLTVFIAVLQDVKQSVKGTGINYSAINLKASKKAREAVCQGGDLYSQQFAPYFRANIRMAFRVISNIMVREWAFDAQDIREQRNALFQPYNVGNHPVGPSYQSGRVPLIQYRIQL